MMVIDSSSPPSSFSEETGVSAVVNPTSVEWSGYQIADRLRHSILSLKHCHRGFVFHPRIFFVHLNVQRYCGQFRFLYLSGLC